MDNHSMLKAFITQFSGKENTIAVNTAYCKFVGRDLSIGAFLSQCIYWSDKSSRKDGFFYKARHEWEDEIFLSDYTIRKATKLLTDMEILETKLIKANGCPTLHYRVKMETFLEKFGAFLMEEKKKMEEENVQTVENTGIVEINKWNLRNQQMESLDSTNGIVEINKTLTEITTETTTKKKDIVEQSSTIDIPYFEIIEYLNKQAGKNCKADAAKNRKLIKARWNEGYTLEDFKHVIDVKTEEWINTKFDKHLVPSTLFAASHFDDYLQQKKKVVEGGWKPKW